MYPRMPRMLMDLPLGKKVCLGTTKFETHGACSSNKPFLNEMQEGGSSNQSTFFLEAVAIG